MGGRLKILFFSWQVGGPEKIFFTARYFLRLQKKKKKNAAFGLHSMCGGLKVTLRINHLIHLKHLNILRSLKSLKPFKSLQQVRRLFSLRFSFHSSMHVADKDVRAQQSQMYEN